MSIMEPHTDKLKYIFDNAKVGIAICNAQDNTLEMVNPAFAHIHGYEPHELIGVSPGEVFAPECMLRLEAHESASSCAINDVDFETTHYKKDGSPVAVSVHITVIKDDKGIVQQRIANITDISVRKDAEEALHQEMELNAEIINAIPDLLFELDGHGTYLNVWAQDATLLAAQREVLLGQTLQEVLPPDAVEVVFRTIKDVDETGHSLGNTFSLDLPGETKWFELSASKRKSSGTYIVLSRDITERKAQEELLHKTKAKLSAVITTIPDLIWVKDAKGIYMMCNPAFENFFGASCDEIIGKTDYDFISKEQADFFRQNDAKTLASGEMCINEEEIILAHNGQHALLETRKIPVYNGQEFMGVLGIGRDITVQKKLQQELNIREQMFRTLAENSPNIIMRYDQYCCRLYVNPAYSRQTGIPQDIAINATPKEQWETYINMLSMSAEEYQQRILNVIKSGTPDTFIIAWYRLNDGVYVAHDLNVVAEHDVNGTITGALAIGHDITKRQQLELDLNSTLSKFEQFVNNITEMAWIKDEQSRFIMANQVTANVAGVSNIDEMIGKTDFDFFPHEQAHKYMEDDRLVIKKGLTLRTEEAILSADGQTRWIETIKNPFKDATGEIIGTIGTARDITERKLIEKKVEFMVHHDTLTGLPNRILAKDRTEQIIAHSKRTGSKAALLFIDLDGFKAINDSMGHSIGDAVLKIIASRLMEGVRACDTISRQGGDEFLLILSDIEELHDIVTIAEKLIQEFDKPFFIGEQALSTSASIGIAIYPENGESFEALLQSADTAMYKAKESGKNAYCFYTQQMNHNLIGQFKLQNDLKNALKHNEFILHYQPQIDLAKNRIIGAEALIRWQHPQMGMVPPMSFISLAESSGIIVQIGQWVIEEACRQAAQWQNEGKEITVAVNISAVQFKRGNLEAIVKNALESSGLNPKLLELELTESILINDVENILKTVQILKGLGIQLSIDDFGTGYSSLAYLKRFAVDKLKIDQSFVRDILKDQEDAAIVRTIIQMAKSLNLKTIAEGVEDGQVLAVIDSYGCDEVQGYHFAKPMEANIFKRYYEGF